MRSTINIEYYFLLTDNVRLTKQDDLIRVCRFERPELRVVLARM